MISSFTNQYAFLSNFYPARVFFEDRAYPTVEHAYQAAKTDDESVRIIISHCHTAGGAKRLGRGIILRQGWEDIKLNVMADLLMQKFSYVSESSTQLARLLLATGDEMLVEGNHWGDTYWGVCRGMGENHLGRLLMARRDYLREALQRQRDKNA